MTYFAFLALFLAGPIAVLAALVARDVRRGRPLPEALRHWPVLPTLLVHVVVALVYTTPWDNYLVATGVWWYDPALVTGLTLGWVPIEEYTFFVLQPILTGLWLIFLARRLGEPAAPAAYGAPLLRGLATAVAGLIWLASVIGLNLGRPAATYLSLELVWALPPIMLQLAFGADILWRNRRLLFWAIAPATLYLAAADAIAIGAGTWTIDPAQSLQIYLGGILPVEEFVFFLLTNILIGFGVTLVLSPESGQRVRRLRPDGAAHRSLVAVASDEAAPPTT